MKKTKEELIDVFENTVKDINQGYYENLNGEVIEFEKDLEMLNNSRLIHSISEQKTKFNINHEPKITVENKDSFQKAREMGEDCLVLDMASAVSAGGGVENGSRAQEEELCRRSNLSHALFKYSSRKYDIFSDLKKPKKFHYPIDDFGAIYVPKVTVYKSHLSYNPMYEPFYCSVVAVAAIRKPKLDKQGLLTEEDSIITKGKIRTILRVAVKYGHTKLVLGALGCGAYGNPPEQIAILFKEVLAEKEFIGCFEEICFAIIEDKNSLHSGKRGNYKPFKEIFK
jgi:uncharacterized protein (TIGR02452 family)